MRACLRPCRCQQHEQLMRAVMVAVMVVVMVAVMVVVDVSKLSALLLPVLLLLLLSAGILQRQQQRSSRQRQPMQQRAVALTAARMQAVVMVVSPHRHCRSMRCCGHCWRWCVWMQNVEQRCYCLCHLPPRSQPQGRSKARACTC